MERDMVEEVIKSAIKFANKHEVPVLIHQTKGGFWSFEHPSSRRKAPKGTKVLVYVKLEAYERWKSWIEFKVKALRANG